MSRAPIRYPLHIVNVSGTDDLVWRKDVLIQDVKTIGLHDDVVYGTYVPDRAANTQVWYISRCSEDTAKSYNDRQEWERDLRNKGVDKIETRSVRDVVIQFMHRGVLPFERPTRSASVRP